MAGSLNRVQLIGNCGRDPEIKSFQNGNRVANFSVACGESWTDKATGEKKEKTEWVNIAVFNDGLIGVVEKYVRKGSKLFVEGKFQTRKYQDQSGADRYVTEVVIQNFGGQIILLGDPKGDGGAPAERSESRGSYGSARSGARPSNARTNYDGPDDEIPFIKMQSIW